MITKEQIEAMEATAERCGGPVIMPLSEFAQRISEDPSQFPDKIAFLEHVQDEINHMEHQDKSRLVLGIHGSYLIEQIYGKKIADQIHEDIIHWHVLHEGEPYYQSLTEKHICRARLKP